MGRILIKADMDNKTLTIEGQKCTNIDFVSAIVTATRNAAKNGMITDVDCLLIARGIMEDALPQAKIKVMDEEKPQRPKSRDFANLDDAMGMFDKLLKETFGKGEGE